MNKPIKILIVEDSTADAELIGYQLRRGGLPCLTQRVESEANFRRAIQAFEPNLILSDFTLPTFDGLSALRITRESHPAVPFIFVSGTIGEERAIEALKQGATDYVLKDNLGRLAPAVTRALQEAREHARRHAAEAALREREERFRLTLDNALDAFVAIDAKGAIIEWNRQAETIFGWPRTQAIDQPLSATIIPSRYRDAHEQGLKRFLASGEHHLLSQRFEITACRRTSEEFPVEISVVPIQTGGSYIFSASVRDLTERKRAEAALLQAQKMEAVGHLTGGVAHDFNNLLTVIMGNLQLLDKRIKDDPFLHKLVQAAWQAAQQGAGLIRKLLAFSRRQPLAPKAICLNQFVAEMAELLRRTLGENIAIETAPVADLWKALADPIQVETALLNLAVNARDAMPQGGKLIIETANVDLDEHDAARCVGVTPGQYVLLAVTDTGAGMPPEVLAHVVEPFFTTKGPGKGSGLGLSMIYGFAKQSGGHLEIYSELAQGTTVKLYLPRAQQGTDQATAAQPAQRASLRGEETILVVEDNEGVRELAARFLAELGYTVLQAANGPAALAILEQGQPIHLLFTDLVMPGGLSGPELAREAWRRHSQTKVLYTSGYPNHAVIHQGWFEAGAALLSKPYDKEALGRKVRSVLDGRPV